jgi:SAM-dependent methyltransferase
MEALETEPEVSEARQQAHYDRIGEAYEAHYADEWSLLYRRRFLYEPLIEGVHLRGRKVLDAMCGSGQTAEYLLSQGAHVYGLDISAQVMNAFRMKLPAAVGVQGSILKSGFEDESFDAVFVTGGLHHVHPRVAEAVTEIHRILKPGGWLCFYEPHTGSLADAARRFWYRHDDLFVENEAAVNLDDLISRNAERFEFVTTRYSGGPAYLLVFNSMVFRVPLSWKARYTRPLLWLERKLERIQGKHTSCFAIVQWRKRTRAPRP